MYLSSQAPKGKFRVMDIDYVDGDHHFLCDFDDLETAKVYADEQAKRAGNSVRFSVFDDMVTEQYRGKCDGAPEIIKKSLRVLQNMLSYVEHRNMTADLLNQLDPTKPAGTKLCDAVMRLWPTPAFEAMAIRHGKSGQAEVYMRRRSMNDTAYPGEWHAPGSLYRHGEKDQHVAARLEGEFGVKIEKFELVGHEVTSEARGTVHSLIFLTQLAGDARIDDRHNWFPVDNLPKVTVDLHEELIIPAAAKVFWKRFLNQR